MMISMIVVSKYETQHGVLRLLLLSLLRYEKCTITILSRRDGFHITHYNNKIRTNNSCCYCCRQSNATAFSCFLLLYHTMRTMQIYKIKLTYYDRTVFDSRECYYQSNSFDYKTMMGL